MKPFSHGLPGVMSAVFAPTAPIHSCTALATHSRGNAFRAIVGTDMPGHAAQDEQVREHIDDVDRLPSTRHPDGQALMGELVDDVEPAELASIVSTVLDKIVGPDVVWPLRSAPDARS